MSLEHEEQQSIDAIKAFWKSYGNLISLLVLLIALGYAAYVGWGSWQNSRMNKGAIAFETLQAALNGNDVKQVELAWGDLRDGFGSMAYADLGALLVAKKFHDLNKFDLAEQALRWEMEHGNSDLNREIAQLRLSELLVDLDKLDEALSLVSAINSKTESIRSISADRKGDILALQGKRELARDAYKLALDNMPKGSAMHESVTAKFVSMGGTL